MCAYLYCRRASFLLRITSSIDRIDTSQRPLRCLYPVNLRDVSILLTVAVVTPILLLASTMSTDFMGFLPWC